MKKRIVIGGIIIIAVVLYSGFNIWVYRYAKSGKALSPENVLREVTPSGAQRIPTPAPRSSPAATPTTPRPTGPGPFACAPDGTCNNYGEAMRKQQCLLTFADSLCLDSCDDTSKRCTK